MRSQLMWRRGIVTIAFLGAVVVGVRSKNLGEWTTSRWNSALPYLFSRASDVSLERTSADGTKINREIASAGDKAGNAVLNTAVNDTVGAMATEEFEFQRKIRARLQVQKSGSPKNFADISYEGKFFVEWKDAKKGLGQASAEKNSLPGNRVARFSFVLANGQRSAGMVEGRLDAENHLLSLQATHATNEFDEDSLSVLKDLISIYAFRTEEDTTGKYEVKWGVASQPQQNSKNQLLKSKIKYLAPQLSSIQILRSENEIRLDPNLQSPIYFKGLEETTMKVEAAKTAHAPAARERATPLKREQMKSYDRTGLLFSHSEYELKKIPFQIADLKAAPALKLNESLKEATLQLSQTSNPFTIIAWESVRPRLDSVSSLPASERLAVFHSLVHSLKTNPEKWGDLSDFIRQNLNDSVKANLAIGALATVGTPESQNALTDLYQDLNKAGNHVELQHSILGAFTTTDAVITPQARNFLNSLVNINATNPNEVAIAQDAAFALGSAIQKGSDSQAEQKLSDYLAAATTPAQKLAGLDAIGNSGNAQFIPVLEKSLNSTDANIREKAVFAARFIQDSRVGQLFNQAMNDANVQVNVAAVKAIAYQNDVKNYAPLLQKCASSANKQLKELCVQTLGEIN